MRELECLDGSPVRSRDGLSDAELWIVYLQPFDDGRIRNYLENLFPARGNEILGFLKRAHNLMDLAKRPFLLHLISQSLAILEERAKHGKQIHAADIYQTVVEAWTARDNKKHTFFVESKLDFMEMLAQKLWKNSTRQIPLRDLREEFQTYLPECFSAVRSMEPDRFFSVLDRFDTEMRTTTFLNRDTEGNYGFAHTSFQEFFLARSLVQGLENNKPSILDLPRLNGEIIAFTLDLLTKRQAAQQTLLSVLENSYQSQISENAFLIVLAWKKQKLDHLPYPASWQLQGAILDGMDLESVTLDHVNCDGASLNKAIVNHCQIRGSFRGANLSEVQGEDARLVGCDFTGAKLEATNLAGANLAQCNFSQAKISSSYLQRADLTDAILTNANLTLVRLGGCKLHQHQLATAHLSHCSQPSSPFPPKLPSFSTMVQIGHSDWVQSAAFSPDGKFIISASDDHTLKLWETSTGKIIHTLAGHEGYVNSAAFSVDGKHVCSASSDQTIKVWEAATGKMVRTLAGHEGYVFSAAFSGDGKLVCSASDDNTIKIWDTDSREEVVHTLKGHSSSVVSAAFSHDGQMIVSACLDGSIGLWQTSSGKLLGQLWGWKNGDWLAMAENDTFNGNPGGLEKLGFLDNRCVYPASEFTHQRRDELDFKL